MTLRLQLGVLFGINNSKEIDRTKETMSQITDFFQFKQTKSAQRVLEASNGGAHFIDKSDLSLVQLYFGSYVLKNQRTKTKVNLQPS